MEPTHITTIAATSMGEHKAKGSRFLAYAYPLSRADDLKPILQNLRDEHHKAVHWCYAYRLGHEGTQFRANDDGEPSGSAGMPILRQIDSAGLTDLVVVVVRYFGGTLLGVPGLIHAYKTATALVLQQADVVEKNIEKSLWLRCEYPYLNDAIRIAKQHQAEIVQQDLQLDCRLQVRVPLAHYAAALAAWQHMRTIDVLEEEDQASEGLA